ncbi:hypothetical protein [Sabulibacter ruber]|uniref:hypothetical protein n=1 Tax=Sabulibacter ruber TaxID=2811901 RepID=UPI001A96D2CB|nr:hypothetical protein [Sabulibacter ruber]
MVFLLSDDDLRVQAGLTTPSSKHQINPREKIFFKTINFDRKDTRNLSGRYGFLRTRLFPVYFSPNFSKRYYG